MCLTHQTTEKDPRQGSPLSAWPGGATEIGWPKRPFDCQLQEARKKTDRDITPAAEAVRVLAHLALPGSLQAKQLRHLPAQLSLGQSCHRQRKSCVYAHTVALVMSNSLLPCRLWPARLLCQGGGSPGKNTEVYWPILVAIPFQSTVFPAALATNSPEYLVLARAPVTQAAKPPPHLALTGDKSKPSRAASGANPSGGPTCIGGNKTTVETQGQCG